MSEVNGHGSLVIGEIVKLKKGRFPDFCRTRDFNYYQQQVVGEVFKTQRFDLCTHEAEIKSCSLFHKFCEVAMLVFFRYFLISSVRYPEFFTPVWHC